MKKAAISLLIILTLCFCACSNDKQQDANKSPEASATAGVITKATATAEAGTTATATAKPTATPKPTPEEPEADDLSDNLVPEKDATFEGITSYEETAWENIWSGSYKVTEGYEGQGLQFTPQAGMSYCSPSYNISPLIKEAGDYEVSFRIKYEGNIKALPIKPNGILIRGGKGVLNSFIVEHGNNNSYFRTKFDIDGDLGEWQKITFLFSCEEEDIDADAIWRVCLEMIDANITSFTIDNFCVREA